MSEKKPRWAEYWNQIHLAAGSDRGRDPHALQAVIRPEEPALYNAAVDYFQRRTVEAAFDRVAPWTGRRVLEIGCGGGRWCKALHARGAVVTGVDHSEAAVQNNRAVHATAGLTFEHMAASQLDVPDASFDVVLTVTVIQHTPHDDQVRAAREIERVLRPGGVLISLEMFDEAAVDAALVHHGDLYLRSRDSWKRMFEAGALRLRESSLHATMPLTRLYVARAKAFFERSIRRSPASAPAAPAPADTPAIPRAPFPDASVPPGRWPLWVHRLHAEIWRGVTVVSTVLTFPIEWLANRSPDRRLANHVMMIFDKAA